MTKNDLTIRSLIAFVLGGALLGGPVWGQGRGNGLISVSRRIRAFRGRPWRGRSALDAVELMNTAMPS